METVTGLQIDQFADALFNTVEEVMPDAKIDDFRQRILSGDPEQALHRCSHGGDPTVANRLSKKFKIDIKQATSFGVDTNGWIDTSAHNYLVVLNMEGNPNNDLILDAAAGQYIPPKSRIGYERFFKGNMFLGPRTILEQICQGGVINTSTAHDPTLSFRRIWGDTSYIPDQ